MTVREFIEIRYRYGLRNLLISFAFLTDFRLAVLHRASRECDSEDYNDTSGTAASYEPSTQNSSSRLAA